MRAISLPAPAKLNLMLRITGRRDDGYHLLQSVFQFLDYHDTVRMETRTDPAIVRLAGVAGIAEHDDLAIRAARLLQQHTGCGQGAAIAVDKQLPLGAGLGGGSSNAATVLHGLNRLWGCGLDDETLAGLGLQLGADVPVFIHGFAAFAEGIGEHLTAIEIERPWYLVITPQVHVSTAEIFAASELTRDCPALKICDLFAAGNGTGWENVCTPVVVARYPQVGRSLHRLDEIAPARMSGTGASVFAAFDSRRAARVAADSLRGEADRDGWRLQVARGLNQSPLITALRHC